MTSDEGYYELVDDFGRSLFKRVEAVDRLKLDPDDCGTSGDASSSGPDPETAFLIASGPQVFGALYEQNIFQPSALLSDDASQLTDLVKLSFTELTKQLQSLLLGFESDCFDLINIIVDFISECLIVIWIRQFTEKYFNIDSNNSSSVLKSVCSAVTNLLHVFSRNVVAYFGNDKRDVNNHHFNLLALSENLTKPVELIEIVHDFLSSFETKMRSFSIAAQTCWCLDTLIRQLDSCSVLDERRAGIYRVMLHHALMPYNRMLNRWLFDGELEDSAGEFIILSELASGSGGDHADESLGIQDWNGLYSLRPCEDEIPVMLWHFLDRILACGRTVAFLRRVNYDVVKMSIPTIEITEAPNVAGSTVESGSSDVEEDDEQPLPHPIEKFKISNTLGVTIVDGKIHHDPLVYLSTDTDYLTLEQFFIEYVISYDSLSNCYKSWFDDQFADHMQQVNSRGLEYFFVEQKLKGHLRTLRSCFFFADGFFQNALCSHLFGSLDLIDDNQNLTMQASSHSLTQSVGFLEFDVAQRFLDPIRLRRVLDAALEESIVDAESWKLLSFNIAAFKLPPPSFDYHRSCSDSETDDVTRLNLRSSRVFDFLHLDYAISGPLTTVISYGALVQYNKIFQHFMGMLWVLWALKDLSRWLTANSQRFSEPVLRRLHLYRHAMWHFVHCIFGYFAYQVVDVSWSELNQNLDNIGSIEELHNAHLKYLNQAIKRCLLNSKAASVLTQLNSLLDLCLKFRIDIVNYDPMVGIEARRSQLKRLETRYKKFHTLAKFLFGVVTRLAERGYDKHFEDLMIRLNFNGFYSS